MTFKADLSGGAVDGVGHVDFAGLYADKPAPPPVNLAAQRQEAERAQRGRELRAVLNDQDASDDDRVYALVMMRRMSIPWPDDHRVEDAEAKVAAFEADVVAKRTAREAASQAATPVATPSPAVTAQNARLELEGRVASMLLTASRDQSETAEIRAAAHSMFSNQPIAAQQIALGN